MYISDNTVMESKKMDENIKKIQPVEGAITLLDVAQTLWNRRWVIFLFTLLTVVFMYAADYSAVKKGPKSVMVR
jgi:LPS O-antigen subunit length determinant protein (WzzB/FepE family)